MMKAVRWPFFVLFLMPFVFLFTSRLLFDFNGLYGQDAHRYYQFVLELEQYFKSGQATGNFRWPVLYPLSGLLLKLSVGIPADLALQLLSTLALAVGAWFVFKILVLNGLVEKTALLFVFVFLLFCPQLAVGSVLCMSDMLGMMWVVLTWYSYFRFRGNGRPVAGMTVGLFAAMALFSRYPVFFLIAWPAVHAFVLLVQRRDITPLLFVVAFVVATIPEFLLQDTSQSVGRSYLLNHWNLGNLFADEFQTVDGTQNYRFINLIYATYPFWHPAFLFILTVLGTLFFKRLSRAKISVSLAVSVAVYLIFLGGIALQNRRFFLPAIPLIVVLLGPFFETVFRKGNKTKGAVALALIFQMAVSCWYFADYLSINRFERQLAADLKSYQGRTLYSFYWDTSLKSYCPNFRFYNLWEKEYHQWQPGDLVLFNPEGLREQWAGTTLMENWNNLDRNYSLEQQEEWPNGWKLYEIE